MNIKNLFFQYKNIIVGVLICLACVGVLKKIYENYLAQKHAIEAKKIDLARKEEISKRAAKVMDEYNQAKQGFLYSSLDSFKEAVESASQRSSIEIDYLQPTKSDKGMYWQATINVGTYSDYKNIVDLVKFLEDASISIGKIVCRPNPAKPDKALYVEMILEVSLLKNN